MYDSTDPRAQLNAGKAADAEAVEFYAADYLRFYERTPTIETGVERSWFTRGVNAVIGYTDAVAGCVLERAAQPDEWALLLPDASIRVRITAGSEEVVVDGNSLTFVPPGDSRIEVVEGGRLVRIFTTVAEDLALVSANAAAGSRRPAQIPPFVPWPVPPDGYRIRSYSLDVPDTPGRFGRIWRCTTLMINVLAPTIGPRDIRKMSPHHHDDFEQYSLALRGSFIHHLRWPWTPDMRTWRVDDHEFCGTPSVAIIPPPAIHTTQAVDPGVNDLVDIFSPPRNDFSNMAGWVLNETDYPRR